MSDYRYIGKDGKTVLARDLEDERDALRARLAEVEKDRDEAKESARWAYIDGCLDGDDDAVLARAERAEVALATARRDALEKAHRSAVFAGEASAGLSSSNVTDAICAAIRALISQEDPTT